MGRDETEDLNDADQSDSHGLDMATIRQALESVAAGQEHYRRVLVQAQQTLRRGMDERDTLRQDLAMAKGDHEAAEKCFEIEKAHNRRLEKENALFRDALKYAIMAGPYFDLERQTRVLDLVGLTYAELMGYERPFHDIANTPYIVVPK